MIAAPGPSVPQPPAGAGFREDRWGWLFVFALLLAALLLRLWALDGRWINADEGAHLMGGRLALEGLVPGLDYRSRQFIYVYIVGGFQQIFGSGLLQGRALAILATLGTGLLLFLIARRLFDRNVALLAVGLFLLLPFSVLMTVHAKTQPQTMLFSGAGVYFLLRGLDSERFATGAFLLCGLALGVAYHVRQSSLGVVLAVLIALVIWYRPDMPRLLRALGVFVVGFLGVSAAVFAFYLTRVGPAEAWYLSDNPVAWTWGNLAESAGHIGPRLEGVEPVAAVPGERFEQPLQVTLQNLMEPVRFHLFLLIGGLASLGYAASLLRRGRRARREAFRAYGIPVLWLVSLSAAYAYWGLRRGFYQAYFLELLPPLCILTAATVREALADMAGRASLLRDGAILAGVLLVFWLIHVLTGMPQLNRPLYFAVGAVLLGLAYLMAPGRIVHWLVAGVAIGALSAAVILLAARLPTLPTLLLYGAFIVAVYVAVFHAGGWSRRRASRSAAGFVCYSLVVSAFALSLAVSAGQLDRSYDALWAPETVREVVSILKSEGTAGDEVMSGAAIWELEAGLHHFRHEAHPLQFMVSMAPVAAEEIRARLRTAPPRFVILDGFTERTYLLHLPEIEDVIETEYVLSAELEGSFFPVRVFRLNR